MANRDIAAGKVKQVEGAFRDVKGDLTGNPNDHLAGKAKKAEGKLQEGMGRVAEERTTSWERPEGRGGLKRSSDRSAEYILTARAFVESPGRQHPGYLRGAAGPLRPLANHSARLTAS
jgi:uncharacterized protein YjbJ (UPF0337 family)